MTIRQYIGSLTLYLANCFGRWKPLKILPTKNFISWHWSWWCEVKIDPDCLWIYFPWSYSAFGTKKPKFLFWGIFKKIKTWQKYASKWFPIKFITAWLLQTAVFFKVSIKYWSNFTQALFWGLESRINSIRTMKKKAKTIDYSVQNGTISICFFVKWQLCFELPFKLVNPAPFLDSTTHLKVRLFKHSAS